MSNCENSTAASRFASVNSFAFASVGAPNSVAACCSPAAIICCSVCGVAFNLSILSCKVFSSFSACVKLPNILGIWSGVAASSDAFNLLTFSSKKSILPAAASASFSMSLLPAAFALSAAAFLASRFFCRLSRRFFCFFGGNGTTK